MCNAKAGWNFSTGWNSPCNRALRITYLIELRITLFHRSPIHFLLANVAVADITFSMFHISELSFRNISNKPEGMSGPGFCFLRISPIQWIGATCSTLSLVLIAFERYFVVRNPHGNQKLSTEKLKARIFFFHSFLGRRKPDSDVVGKPIHAWRYQQNQFYALKKFTSKYIIG